METNEIVQYNKKIIAKQKKIQSIKEDNEELYMLAKKIDNCIERLEMHQQVYNLKLLLVDSIENVLKLSDGLMIVDIPGGEQMS
ncbi:hypothetical protein DXC08_15195, partial [Clostridium sp. OM07-9AC]